MKALVTGAPGFLGSHIARSLVDAGHEVRGLALHTEALTNLEGVEIDVVRGNVLSPDDMRRAVYDVDTVFHAAAVYESWAPDPGPMYSVNLRGTFNVLEAARRADVSKVVYTASIVALGRPPAGEVADEQTPYEAWDLDFAYSRSKYFSKLLAQDFAAWGLDVRIVCPGIVIGPGDITPTPSGRMILGLARGKAPGYSAGGASFVDVRDAAAGHLAAAQRGKAGEVYIVTGHNLDNRQLIDVVMEVVGRRRRNLKIPTAIARAFVGAMQAAAVRRGKKPELARVFFEYGLRCCYYDNAKAVRELELSFRPIEDTVRAAVEDFRARGLL